MEAVYLFASEKGDVRVEREVLESPFIIRPMEGHPFLSLGDFFDGVRDFLLQDKGARLLEVLKRAGNSDSGVDEIERLVIRYEKYGTLYHITSVEAAAGDLKKKFVVSAAQTSEAKEAIDEEFGLFEHLNKKCPFKLIPHTYFKGKVLLEKSGKSESLTMALSEWFEGYHEWHFETKPGGAERASVWDMEKGFRYAEKDEINEIIQQASRILTMYYDVKSFDRIIPWHHGAGDFVVKTDEKGVDVKLISVRGYAPIDMVQHNRRVIPVDALLFFLLETTVKMRIDKVEGMGDPIWAGDFILESVVTGFFEGLRFKEQNNELGGVNIDELKNLLKGFSQKDLELRFERFLEYYRKIDFNDYTFISRHQKRHSRQLHEVIQRLTG